MPRTCGNEQPLSDTQRTENLDRLNLYKNTFATGELPYLTIPVVYTVLFDTNDENVSLELIRANHEQITMDFTATNPDLESIPTLPPYNTFRSVTGDAKIAFEPLNPFDITEGSVRRIKVNTIFSGIVEILNLYPPVDKSLNVYISNLQTSLLGQALYSTTNNFTACVVRFDTVGSTFLPGPGAPYNLGRTLTHEIGHTMSIEHPWTPGCDGVQAYADVPRTKEPNIVGTFDSANLESGVGPFGGNHWNDIHDLNDPIRSCTGVEDPGIYELFFQFAEYVNDSAMVMWSNDQALTMYAWTDTIGRDMLTVGEVDVIPTPSEIPDDGGGLSPGAIAGIVIGVVIGVILIAMFIVYSMGPMGPTSSIANASFEWSGNRSYSSM